MAAAIKDIASELGNKYPELLADIQGTSIGKQLAVEHWPEEVPLPLVLAGGLNAGNVAAAMAAVAPYGVDVAGGVEGGTKGIKDHQKMNDFIAAVKAADRLNQ